MFYLCWPYLQYLPTGLREKIAFLIISKKKIMQPCRATNQSNVCLIAGLTIFILPEGYNEWLSSLITSLYNEFSIQYGIALLVSSLSYVGSSVHNLTTIP